MTFKELRNLSDDERKEVQKDWWIAIGLFIGCSVLFAALALITQYRMG